MKPLYVLLGALLGFIVAMELIGDRYYAAKDMGLAYQYGCSFGSRSTKDVECFGPSLVFQKSLEKQ